MRYCFVVISNLSKVRFVETKYVEYSNEFVLLMKVNVLMNSDRAKLARMDQHDISNVHTYA